MRLAKRVGYVGSTYEDSGFQRVRLKQNLCWQRGYTRTGKPSSDLPLASSRRTVPTFLPGAASGTPLFFGYLQPLRMRCRPKSYQIQPLASNLTESFPWHPTLQNLTLGIQGQIMTWGNTNRVVSNRVVSKGPLYPSKTNKYIYIYIYIYIFVF